MLWWLYVLALFHASARWTAVSLAVRVFFFACGVAGLLMTLQTGCVPAFLKAVIEIPLLFLAGVFGIIKAALFPQRQQAGSWRCY